MAPPPWSGSCRGARPVLAGGDAAREEIRPVAAVDRAMPEITRVGVLGCGQMGSGIAQVAATAGFSTIVRDVEAGMLAKGQGAIRKSLDKLVDKAKLDPAARDAALAHLNFTTRLGDLDGCDLIIEAVTEDLQLKTELWRALDASAPAPTIFASNTSSLSIGDMAAATGRPTASSASTSSIPCRSCRSSRSSGP